MSIQINCYSGQDGSRCECVNNHMPGERTNSYLVTSPPLLIISQLFITTIPATISEYLCSVRWLPLSHPISPLDPLDFIAYVIVLSSYIPCFPYPFSNSSFYLLYLITLPNNLSFISLSIIILSHHPFSTIFILILIIFLHPFILFSLLFWSFQKSCLLPTSLGY